MTKNFKKHVVEFIVYVLILVTLCLIEEGYGYEDRPDGTRAKTPGGYSRYYIRDPGPDSEELLVIRNMNGERYWTIYY